MPIRIILRGYFKSRSSNFWFQACFMKNLQSLFHHKILSIQKDEKIIRPKVSVWPKIQVEYLMREGPNARK